MIHLGWMELVLCQREGLQTGVPHPPTHPPPSAEIPSPLWKKQRTEQQQRLEQQITQQQKLEREIMKQQKLEHEITEQHKLEHERLELKKMEHELKKKAHDRFLSKAAATTTTRATTTRR